MKKLITFVLLVVVSIATFSQKNNPAPLLTKQDYLQKSRNQKTAAWILRGSGAVLFIPGIIWATTSIDSVGPDILLVAGGACILTSVPLFMASRKNKRRAMTMSLNWQQSIQKKDLVKTAIPSLALQIRL